MAADKTSERHHWWPECVSRHWADDDGGVHCLLPDGRVRRAAPRNFGVIGNGHVIKLSHEPEHAHIRFQNFEHEFQEADSKFPQVLRWLDELDRAGPPFEVPLAHRFLPQDVTDAQFADAIECVVSLAVRSPMHREQAVSLAEHFRGPLPERERNVLIGANMRYSLRNAIKAIGGRGKVVVMYSPEREFIFGDGFFSNIQPPVQHLSNPRILVPLTPWMAVLFARPVSYRIEPRLFTISASSGEVDLLNHAILTYSRSQVFYRSEKPVLIPEYTSGKHLVYADDQNPVDSIICQIPGFPKPGRRAAFFGE